MPLQEHEDSLLEDVLIFAFPVSVALVQGVHVPDRALFGPQRFDHLDCLCHGDAGVVLPLDNEHRHRDSFYIVQRTDLMKKGAHRRITLIAIFRTTLVPTIVLCVFEKSNEVTDTDVIDDRTQPVTVVHCACQRHVATIAGAIYRNTTRVEVWLRLDPVE